MSESTWSGSGGAGGGGDVFGPPSSTDNAVVRFNGATGDTLQDSGVIISDTNDITGVTSIEVTSLTANRAIVSDGTKKLSSSAVTSTELGYLSGVTSALQTQLNDKLDDSQRGAANGVASLDATGKVPQSELPAIAITDTFVVASQAAMLALTAQTGDVAVRTDLNKSFILAGSNPAILANWQELLTPTDAVLSVNGETGAVSLDTTDIPEGSNLYYTDERAQDSVGTILVDTDDLDFTYNDATPSISVVLRSSAITAKGLVTADVADALLISDASDSGALKRAVISDFGLLTATQTFTNKTLDNPIIDNGATFLHETTPATPSVGRVRVYPKSDNTLYVLDSSGIETPVGSGTAAGFINYVTNADAQSGTTGWATYADAAVATPVDGTGGTPNVTWTRNTSSPLRGNADFAFAKDAANRQGQGVSFAFTIATTDRSKKCQISFDFDTVKTNYAAGDMRVYVYDVTNATLITPQTVDIPRATSTFQTTFDSTTSTSYRLILHVASTNATAYTVNFDNFVVNANAPEQGAAISEWQSYTPVVTGVTTLNVWGYWQRVGSSLVLEGGFNLSAAGSAQWVYSLPTGLTIDTTKIPSSGSTTDEANHFGTGTLEVSGTDQRKVDVLRGATNGLSFSQILITSGSGVLGSGAGASGWQIRFTAIVPIAEWAGSGTVNLGAGAQQEFLSTSFSSFAAERSPAGTALPTTTPAGTNEQVDMGALPWQYPQQVTDFVRIEIQNGGTGPWLALANADISEFTFDGTNYIGLGLIYTSGTYKMIRGKYRAAGSGTWATMTAGTRYRLVKARPSAPVGFEMANSNESGLVKPRKGQYSLTVTSSQAGWSTTRAVGVYYQDQDGNHRLKFNINGDHTSATVTSVTLTITGLTFKNVSGYVQACSGFYKNATSIIPRAYASPNTSTIILDSASAGGTTGVFVSGDVELESRPSWA